MITQKHEMTAVEELACRAAMEKAGLADLYLYGADFTVDEIELKDEEQGRTVFISFEGYPITS